MGLEQMMFLVFCCSCYGAMLILLFLKGCLSKGDRLGRSGEKQVSEPDEAGCPMQDQEPEKEDSGQRSFKTGRGKGKGRFTHSKLPSNSLWIERKLFCASRLLPGRMIRVTEMLSDRRFTVDLNTNELVWLIAALREAFSANSGSFFKQISNGSKSLELYTDFNRAGVVLKLKCSFGGRNRRFLFIPAGKNREGWGGLAKYLASVSNGGKVWVKKPSLTSKATDRVESSQHRESSVVRGKANRSLLSLDDLFKANPEWNEGFLPDLLKSGLNLCLGAPSSSGEANRCFAWKSYQSELGLGTLVVEHFHRDDSLGLKNNDDQLERGRDDSFAGVFDVVSSGEHVGKVVAEEEVAVRGEEEDEKDSSLSDEDEVSSLGNLISKVQIITLSSDALKTFNDDPLADGPSSAGLDQQVVAASGDALSPFEHSGCVNERAEELQLACGLLQQGTAAAHVTMSLGEIMGFGDELMGFRSERAEEDQTCQISGGLAAGSDVRSYQFEGKGMGSFLGNAHVHHEGSPDMRFMARHEDITIFDNEETLSFDSPASDSSVRIAEETSAEDGFSCPDEFCVICGSPEPCGGIGGFVRW